MLKDRTISATEFKAKCLSILEQLDSRGIVITKRGKPLAKVLPARAHANERLIGSMKGRIVVKGDLFSTGVRWDADARHPYRGGAAQRRVDRPRTRARGR
jgi:prevent-host-death family protein